MVRRSELILVDQVKSTMSKQYRRLSPWSMAMVLMALVMALTPIVRADDDMKTGLPRGWFGGPFGGGAYDVGIDVKTFKSGNAAAFIRCNAPGNGAVLTQMVAPADLAGKRVRYSAPATPPAAQPPARPWP